MDETSNAGSSPVDRKVRDLWAGHHIWCNFAGGRMATECSMCKKLFEQYPQDGMTEDELAAKHFPAAVKRTGSNLNSTTPDAAPNPRDVG